MMALLGWNPGNTTQEIFSKEELCKIFSLEHVNKSGSKFDPEKNKWFNKQYMERLDNSVLAKYFIEDAAKDGVTVDPKKAETICGLVKDRCHFTHDLWKESTYFFIAPTSYDEVNKKKFWKEDTPAIMREVVDILKQQPTFAAKTLEENITKWIKDKELGMGKVLNPVRLLLCGACKGPHIFDILENLGKDESISRIEKGIEAI